VPVIEPPLSEASAVAPGATEPVVWSAPLVEYVYAAAGPAVAALPPTVLPVLPELAPALSVAQGVSGRLATYGSAAGSTAGRTACTLARQPNGVAAAEAEPAPHSATTRVGSASRTVRFRAGA